MIRLNGVISTRLFVDEASHATEANVVIALQSPPNKQHMMLARDPKQLAAPVHRCSHVDFATGARHARCFDAKCHKSQVIILTWSKWSVCVLGVMLKNSQVAQGIMYSHSQNNIEW
jgi:hypothetical protein